MGGMGGMGGPMGGPLGYPMDPMNGGSHGMHGMAPGYGSSSLVGLQASKQPGQPVTTARSARTSTGTPSGAYPAGGSISAAPLPARTTSMRGMYEKKENAYDVFNSKALALNSPRQGKASPVDQRHADLAKLQAMIAAKDKEIKEIRRQNDIQAAQYDRSIKEVRDALVARTQHAARLEAVLAGRAPPKEVSGLQRQADAQKRRAKTSAGSRLGRVAQGTPVTEHVPVRGDEIDMRLAELYNQTTSAILFKRINKGCYIFGTLQVDVDLINHKLMIKTDDGWNRGNFGPVEKFLYANENLEREKLHIPLDP